MSEIVSNTDLKWVFCRSKKNKRGEKKIWREKRKEMELGRMIGVGPSAVEEAVEIHH